MTTASILKALFSGTTSRLRYFDPRRTTLIITSPSEQRQNLIITSPSDNPRPVSPTNNTTRKSVTLIPGDGISPFVTGAVEQIIDAMQAPVCFEKFEVRGDMNKIPDGVMDSIRRNKVCLKGELVTPVGGGINSLNVMLS